MRSLVRLGVPLLCVALAGTDEPDAPDDAPAAAPERPAARRLNPGPRTGPEREKALRRFGGNAATEEAVAAGLDWLARHQGDDGLWDADGFAARCNEKEGSACTGAGKGQHGEEVACPFDAAISALATLAFLGHGHVPGAEQDAYADVVARALAALREPADRWSLALALEAFAEAEAMTPARAGRYREAVDDLAARLLALRQEDGAFGYAAPWRPGSDVPYTALATSALIAARDAGVALPDDLGAGIDAFLGRLDAKEGRLAYLADGAAYGYTPTATNAHLAAAIRELLGMGTSGARHRSHLALVARTPPRWKIAFDQVDVPGRGTVTAQVGSLSMYQWWYGCIATFHAGAPFAAYFAAVKSALLPHQRKEGCARGSFDPVGTYERQTGGRVFATALGVLMLEQPYRHRP